MSIMNRTASDLFLESLYLGGADVAFAVFGTDHPGLIESFSKHEINNHPPVPRLVVCQHENIAMNAALGYAHFSGRTPAVIAHVDVGTANLGLGMHNAARNRLPVFVFAGVAPWTEHGERIGGRDSYVQYVQDVYDQPGQVREYVKWEYEVRSGSMFPAAVARGLQFAASHPRGPVYCTAAREPLEEPAPGATSLPSMPPPAATMPIPSALDEVAAMLAAARAPLIVTSSAGSDPAGAEALRCLAEAVVAPVVEMRPYAVNMPVDHPLHHGFNMDAKPFMESADLVLSVECDVPWIPVEMKPPEHAKVVWLGTDPIALSMPMRSMQGDIFLSGTIADTLDALRGRVAAMARPGLDLVARQSDLAGRHDQQRRQWAARAEASENGLTASQLAAIVAPYCDNDETLVIQETTTSAVAVLQQLRLSRPGQMLGPAASGLGLGLPAALGAKLARPEANVISLVGDGSYVLSVPSAVHWASREYDLPFLTVVVDNGGWAAVAQSTRRVHPHGLSVQAGVPQARWNHPLDLAKIVEAAGGTGFTVSSCVEATEALAEAWSLVREGQSAVVVARVTDWM